MSGDRIPCINPRCRRTFKDEGLDCEIICGRCFRTLPTAVRKEHRTYWREIRKWERRIARTSDELKILKMRSIVGRLSRRLNLHWNREIKTFFLEPVEPAGLDRVLEDLGLGDRARAGQKKGGNET